MTATRALFAADGPIARSLARYEARDAQVRMAEAVAAVIDASGVLLAEAGTGTGKTLAYLAPAVESGRRVVISTGTKNLQEQVFFKDLAFLGQALGRTPNAVYLKGQENYLCRRRLEAFLGSPRVLAYPPERIAALERFAARTTTGDRMELGDLPDEDPLWHEVASTKETRIGPRCPHHEECFVTLARREAQSADIIVVNHHLYFADLATRFKGGSLLPAHEVIVFDEAHLIEDVATEFFSTKVSSRRWRLLLDDVDAAVARARLAEDPEAAHRRQLVDHARARGRELFELFRGDEGRYAMPLTVLDEPSRQEALRRAIDALTAVEMSVRIIPGRSEELDHLVERLVQQRHDVEHVLSPAGSDNVHWVELRPRSVVLGASPVNVAGFLREGIFFGVRSVILTSATLSTSGDFRFLRERLGIDFDVSEISVPSPFDYSRQACLYVPHGLPDPRDPAFIGAAIEETTALIDLTAGGALVLCTSLRNMRLIHTGLVDRVPGPLLLQGTAPKSRLLACFIEDHRSVLVATTSFWQGVDLAGDALRLVVIDKLPFASPADPLVAARVAETEARGHNGFTSYQLPVAALALKQGFGRLVRTADDTGIVAVLDPRLATARYGRTFLDSLPPATRVHELHRVVSWWHECRGVTAARRGTCAPGG